ncbi:hypothetical protein [Nocardia nova]|uniref:hypothetical protein n=1 Tax=Nocardia nova TaxID=37330 RepID=UPI001FEB675D|nr:hypothetical protein [Nocardia nova]
MGRTKIRDAQMVSHAAMERGTVVTGSSQRSLAACGVPDSVGLVEALTGSGVFMGFLEIRVRTNPRPHRRWAGAGGESGLRCSQQ